VKKLLLLVLLSALLGTLVWAQRRGGRGGWIGEGVRTAREVPSNSTGTPIWNYPNSFEKDVFTFTRIRYSRGGFGRGGGWSTDLPDADLNLSFRLQQMTSMKVDPDGRIVALTDPELADFPFIYMAEPGNLAFTDEEAAALRRYLLNGGFLLLDDFWGEDAWANVEYAFKQVFPERAFAELPIEHPLYTSVFQIKSKGQVPNVGLGVESQYSGITWEREDARTVHHRALFDDKGRLMTLALHNTDNGDGWEREGESDYYFKNFSENIAYPLGINVIFYIMTH
jgi:hypothetical protein